MLTVVKADYFQIKEKEIDEAIRQGKGIEELEKLIEESLLRR